MNKQEEAMLKMVNLLEKNSKTAKPEKQERVKNGKSRFDELSDNWKTMQKKTRDDYHTMANVYKGMCDEEKDKYNRSESDKIRNIPAEELRDRLNELKKDGEIKIKVRDTRILSDVIFMYENDIIK